jgi:hypothetical protein
MHPAKHVFAECPDREHNKARSHMAAPPRLTNKLMSSFFVEHQEMDARQRYGFSPNQRSKRVGVFPSNLCRVSFLYTRQRHAL